MSNLLREYVSSVLAERGAIPPAPVVLTNKQIEDQITAAVKNLADVSHVDCKGPVATGDGHCRIFLNDLKDKTDRDFMKIAKEAIRLAFGGRPIVANIGQVHSGKFDTYEVTDPNRGYKYNIVFSGGLTSGQRGGGYAYEGEVKKLLGIGGTQSEDVKADTTLSDVFVKTKSGTNIGIEVKGAGAKFGQPTLHYSFKTNQFVVPPASRSSKNAQLVADILNTSEEPELNQWLNKLRLSWNKIHPEDKMSVLSTQIQVEDWKKMMSLSSLKQSGPSVPFKLDQIVKYYAKKKAQYIQIQGKGLYSFDDVLELDVTSFVEAAKNLNAFIKPEILLSGGNKVLRASISLNYSSLTRSSMDLADASDAKKFSAALSRK